MESLQALMLAWPLGIAMAAMVAVALAFVVFPLARSRKRSGPDGGALHLHAARVSAAELDRALAAGEWSKPAHAEARHELEADLVRNAPVADTRPPRHASPRLAWGLVLAVPCMAVALYAALGDPAALARNTVLPADHSLRDLASYMADHPRDARGWVLRARAEAEAERFADAARSYARAVSFPKVAQDPAIWCEYADALGMAQGGRLAGEPQKLIAQALTKDPTHPQALEMAGSAAYEIEDYHTAAKHWRALLERMPANARQQRTELEAAIARTERLAATRLPGRASLANNLTQP